MILPMIFVARLISPFAVALVSLLATLAIAFVLDFNKLPGPLPAVFSLIVWCVIFCLLWFT